MLAMQFYYLCRCAARGGSLINLNVADALKVCSLRKYLTECAWWAQFIKFILNYNWLCLAKHDAEHVCGVSLGISWVFGRFAVALVSESDIASSLVFMRESYGAKCAPCLLLLRCSSVGIRMCSEPTQQMEI